MEYKYTCEKCGHKTNGKKAFWLHLHRRKHSCNKEYDIQILNRAYEKIKTYDPTGTSSIITYEEEDGYKLTINKSCFYNPYFEDYFITYEKLDKVFVQFFAEWARDKKRVPIRGDKLVFSK